MRRRGLWLPASAKAALAAATFLGAAVILALALTGCGASESANAPTEDQSASAQSPDSPDEGASNGAAIAQMPLEARQAELPPEFPIEVPVPDGRVLSAEQQGERVWLYEVVLDAALADVVSYYERVYAGANWGLADKTVGEGSAALVFAKGNAEATVDATAESDGTHAMVAVGLGVPVSSTY